MIIPKYFLNIVKSRYNAKILKVAKAQKSQREKMPKNTSRTKITQKKDNLFSHKKISKKAKFCFDERVASVFDDMLERSIPYYKDNLALCVDFITQHIAQYTTQNLAQKPLKNTSQNSLKNTSQNLSQKHLQTKNQANARIYDIGCSTGNTLLELASRLKASGVKAKLIGIDNSSAMIENATLKAKAYGASICFVCADCNEVEYKKARCFIANYTLQFIRPPKRVAFLKKIYDALESGGVLILSEKMTSQNAMLDAQMIEHYHRYKAKNGYTKTEISTKREALENVLVPYSLQENIALLCEAGFCINDIEVLFKWVNFGTIIAQKV